jgi:hypothetical protein
MRFAVGAETFDRGHLFAVDRPERRVARVCRLPVDQNEAGAAHPKPAAEPGALQAEMVT